MNPSTDLCNKAGPDFDARMRERYKPAQTKVVSLSDYAGQGRGGPARETPWDRTLDRLGQADPAVAQAWFAQLVFRSYADGALTLSAPSRFSQCYIETHLMTFLVTAAEPEFGPIHMVVFA